MRYLVALCLGALLITACNQGESRYSTTGPEVDEIKAHIAHYETGDWEAWLGHYADTAKIYHNSIEGASPAETQKQLTANLEATSSYGFQEKDRYFERVIEDDGDTWVNFWGTWEGTLAANDQKLIIPVHVTFQIDGNKIVEEHGYYDLTEFTMAMMAIEEAMKADSTAVE